MHIAIINSICNIITVAFMKKKSSGIFPSTKMARGRLPTPSQKKKVLKIPIFSERGKFGSLH